LTELVNGMPRSSGSLSRANEEPSAVLGRCGNRSRTENPSWVIQYALGFGMHEGQELVLSRGCIPMFVRQESDRDAWSG
jgi:hypothetical protein